MRVHAVEKRQGFLWTGSDQATGAKCLVPWDMVCSQLRQVALPLYRAITSCKVGNGRCTCTPFWLDAWCASDDLANLFPAIFFHARIKGISVHDLLGQCTALVSPRTSLSRRGLICPLCKICCRGSCSPTPLMCDTALLWTMPDIFKRRLSTYGCRLGMPPPAPDKLCLGQLCTPTGEVLCMAVSLDKLQSRVNLAVPDDSCEVCSTSSESTSQIFFLGGFDF
jgi:hypothetical protein